MACLRDFDEEADAGKKSSEVSGEVAAMVIGGRSEKEEFRVYEVDKERESKSGKRNSTKTQNSSNRKGPSSKLESMYIMDNGGEHGATPH